MIVIKLKGGLGNQLFQYAAAKSLAKKNDTTLLVDNITGFINDPYERQYCLDKFSITAEIATLDIVDSLIGKNKLGDKIKTQIEKWFKPISQRTIINEPDYHFSEKIANLKTQQDIYLEGYFHTEKYFNDIKHVIDSEFELKIQTGNINQKYLQHIESTESVSVHIRKYDRKVETDSSQINGICTSEYYEQAIGYIKERVPNAVFFIFSDDIKRAKEEISVKSQTVVFVDHNKIDTGLEDFQMMRACKHNIIANSSFSWWGAWLNRNPSKIVIAPEKWLATNKYNFKDVVPGKWIKL